MNFIGAILLLFLAEEAVFWLLATIVENLLPDYFTRDMHGVKVRVFSLINGRARRSYGVAQADVLVFKELVREKLPRLMTHFQRLDYNLGMVVQPWFLCLFTTYLPTHVCWLSRFAFSPRVDASACV